MIAENGTKVVQYFALIVYEYILLTFNLLVVDPS